MPNTRPLRIYITGASSGLGLGLAKRYLASGHIVGGCGIEDKSDFDGHARLHYQKADVRDREALGFLIQQFAEEHSGLDVLIAFAGINHPKAAIPDWDRAHAVMQINVTGLMNALEPAINIMAKQKSGQIVGIGSLSGLVGLPGMASYGASKAATIAMLESLDVDLRPMGIAVTTVTPGFIDTPLTRNNPHKMPFLLKEEEAVELIFKAIQARKRYVSFPQPLSGVMETMRRLPRGVYRWIAERDPTGLKD
jgi:NAD(P)-dependent dehydrogenase (short-subunit alcohol dehydrogenase family)